MVALLGPKLFVYTDLGHPAKKGGFYAAQSVDRRVLAAPPSSQQRAKRVQCCRIRSAKLLEEKLKNRQSGVDSGAKARTLFQTKFKYVR